MPSVHFHPFRFGPGPCCCPCWSWSDDFDRPGNEYTDWLSPSASGEFVDGEVSWSDAANVYTDNNQYATVDVDSDNSSHYLLAYDFGAAVPAGSTIAGIVVRVRRKASVVDVISDKGVYLHTNGALVLSGDNKASAATWDTDEEVVLYGAEDDFWTLGLLPADVNNANFGVAIAVQSSLGESRTASIDQVEMKIWWTNPVSTNVGNNWEEVTGDWGVDTNHLVEKHGGGGTANARLISTVIAPTSSYNAQQGSILIMEPNVGDVYRLYLALPNKASDEPRVEAEYLGGVNDEWEVTVYAGGESATKTMQATTTAHDTYLLSGCIEPWDYDNRSRVNMRGYISSTGKEYPWLDDVSVNDGKLFGVGHNNTPTAPTYGAFMDDFHIEELMVGTTECGRCFCRCNKNVMFVKELTATFFGCTGDATCLEGEQFDMDWEWFGASDRWYGQRTITFLYGPETFTFILTCGALDEENPFNHITLTPDISGCCSAGCAGQHPWETSRCNYQDEGGSHMRLYFGPWNATGLSCHICDKQSTLTPFYMVGGTFNICVSRRDDACTGPPVEGMAKLARWATEPDIETRMKLWLDKRNVPSELFETIVAQFGPPPKAGCTASAWLRRVKAWVKARG